MTYGMLVVPKTAEELARECSIINVLRERERCAKIAEAMGSKATADAIRAQSEDFTFVADVIKEQQEECPICHGSGSAKMHEGFDTQCPACQGKGWIYAKGITLFLSN